MALDVNLHLASFLPPAGASNATGVLDLGVDTQAFSDQWRQGRLRVFIPALPNATNALAGVTLMVQDTIDGVNFSNTDSQLVLPGVAVSGIPAQVVDMAMPPGLRGPFQVSQTVAANGGDNTAALVEYFWVNE